MGVLFASGKELFGLFVGDTSHAVAMLVWIAVTAFLTKTIGAAPWMGPVLFAGLAVILIENVRRAVRPARKDPSADLE